MSVELEQIVEAFGQRSPNPFYRDYRGDAPKRRYLIAMTPRSGSTMLARQLSALDIGHPQEFLNEGFIANFDLLFPPPNLSDFEQFIVSNYTSKNGVFGLKADYHRFAHSRKIGYLSALYSDIDVYI